MSEPTVVEPLSGARLVALATEVGNWAGRQAREQLGPNTHGRPWVLLYGNTPMTGRLHATIQGAETELCVWVRERIAALQPSFGTVDTEQLKTLVSKKTSPFMQALLVRLATHNGEPHQTNFSFRQI